MNKNTVNIISFLLDNLFLNCILKFALKKKNKTKPNNKNSIAYFDRKPKATEIVKAVK